LYSQNSRGIPRECCEHSRYRRIHAAYANAETAYTKAVSLDPDPEVGKAAGKRLQELPE
jgi:hypothetical protein